MAGYNYNFYLDEAQSKVKKEFYKETTITLLVRRCQFKIKYRTPIKVKPDQWDKVKQEVRRNKVGYASDNDYLATIKRYAKDVFIETSKDGVPLTHAILKEALDEKLGLNQSSSKNSFINYIEDFIIDAKRTKEKSTIKGYVTTQNHLLEFFKTSDITPKFESINLIFYDKFLAYSFNKKKHAVNTFGSNIKNIKMFLRESYDRQLHDNNIFQNRKFKKLEEITDAVVLSMDEIEHLYKLDLSDNPRLDRVRDIFVVACLTGLRYSDLKQITQKNIRNEMIEIVLTKTKGISPDPVIIPLLGVAPKIFEKYRSTTGEIMPRILTNQKMNGYIKEVASKASFDELIKNPKFKIGDTDQKKFVPKSELIATHTARRSFASNAYLLGIPILDIMRITGHKTIKAFMRYIRMSNNDAAKRVQAGWIESQEEQKNP